MKKYFKPTLLALLAAAFLGSATLVAARVQRDSANGQVAKETKKVQKRALPVLVFSGVQMVWKIFSAEEN